MKNVFDHMKDRDAIAQANRFAMMQKTYDHDMKVTHAEQLVYGFLEHPEINGMAFVSVGGLDSITLLTFIRKVCRISADLVTAVSVSSLEDKSIQRIHKELGVIELKPLKSKVEVLNEFGWPVLSKEIAGKIALLQNPTPQNATVRHAIITGETGEYGGFQKNSRMKLSQKWLEKFGGYENETEGTNYGIPDFKVSDRCCYYLKERPCDIYSRKTGRYPFMGLMASEGGRRAKALMLNGCNYISPGTKRSAPFAIFDRQDVLQLALDLNVPVPEIYGEIVRDPDGTLRTTQAQRTGCSMCGFGIQLERRPHRFDMLYFRNPKEWEFWMTRVCKKEDGTPYGWGHILDYIGVEWRNPE